MYLWQEKINSYWVAGCVYCPLHSGGDRLPRAASIFSSPFMISQWPH